MTIPKETAVIPADPVFDGELVDNERPTNQRQRPGQQLALWWQRCPRVPPALKSRTHAVQSTRDATVTIICAPWWFLRATGRGGVLAARVWRRWVTVRDYEKRLSSRRSWRISTSRSVS